MYRQTVDIPRNTKTYYSEVELLVDIMHLNDISFLISISEYIYYGIADTADIITYKKLEVELKNVIGSYFLRAFKIILIILDIQFKALKDKNALGVLIIVV